MEIVIFAEVFICFPTFTELKFIAIVLFEMIICELGKHRLSKYEAGKYMAKEIAHEICKGSITPIEGAKQIWNICIECGELTQEIGIFGGRVGEYDDLPHMHDHISNLIKADAKSFIGNH